MIARRPSAVVIALAAALAACEARAEDEGPYVCRPSHAATAQTRLPVLMWNHGRVVSAQVYEQAKRAWRIKCQQFADALGAIYVVPLRGRLAGPANLPGEKAMVHRAIDAAKMLPDADPARIVVMGHSRGALLSLMAAVERADIAGVVMTAPPNIPPATADAARRAGDLRAPALLMVEQSDDEGGLDGYRVIANGLRAAGADHVAIFYDRGGGHMMFTSHGYWWSDLEKFLVGKAGFVLPAK